MRSAGDRTGGARRDAIRAGILCASLLAGAGCGDGATVRLGERNPRPYRFEAPVALAELGPGDNPTLTADLLEIYFTSAREGNGGDVWFASRASPDVAFDPPVPVPGVNTAEFETSPAISADGLTLWVGSDRAGTTGDLDVWMFTRGVRSGSAAAVAWIGPVNLLSLNTPGKEGPRPLGQHDLVMPFASDRDSPAMYRTYLAQRPSAAAPFGAPKLVSELIFAERSTVDAFLTGDGLTLFFCSAPLDGPGDLYVAWRRSLSQPFEVYVPIDSLNTAGDDRDPWLSRDGKLLFFSSDRDGSGQLGIYSARVIPNPL